MGSVEADDERQIAVADDWQLQRLAHSSSTNTAAPCPGDIGGPSEQAYTRPAPKRPASAAQYAVDVTVLDLYFLVPVTIRTAAFRTRCSLLVTLFGAPTRIMFQ